jgi:prepilin-type N-terminal cleavage/methylation domain-containing protein
MRRDGARDDGLTLVELLVTVAIMGIAFSAIVAGMFMYTTSATSHRDQAEAQLQLREFAERVVVAPYVDCKPAYDDAYVAPAGSVRSSVVTLWNPLTSAFDIPAAAGCTDPKLQRVTITITRGSVATYTYSTTLDVVKRG